MRRVFSVKKAMVLFFLIALTVPLFAAIVSSDDLTTRYGISYEERQKSNYIEKDGYSFRYMGDGKWEVLRLKSGGSSSGGGRAKNWASGELGIIGAGVRYDFQLMDMLSVGGGAYYHWWFGIWDSWGIRGHARFYPGVLDNAMYAELGLGYGRIYGYESIYSLIYDWRYYRHGVLIEPAFG
ncbi:MAG: hypothetical protein LBH42_00175, partial [Treponema sp.]|nr:hypothetical protein [Treponema sp.]